MVILDDVRDILPVVHRLEPVLVMSRPGSRVYPDRRGGGSAAKK